MLAGIFSRLAINCLKICSLTFTQNREAFICQVHCEANHYLKHPSLIHTTELLKHLSTQINPANSSLFLSLPTQRPEERLRQKENVQSYLLYKHPLLDPAKPMKVGQPSALSVSQANYSWKCCITHKISEDFYLFYSIYII